MRTLVHARMHTHAHTHAQRHLQVTIIIVGIIPGMVIIKGSFELPGCLGKMIWLASNNELWESACPALIFLPWHPLQGCQSDGQIKRPTTFFFLSPELPPGAFLFSLSGGLPRSVGMSWKLNYLLTGPLKKPSMTYCAMGKEKRRRPGLLFIHISQGTSESVLSTCPPFLSSISYFIV